MFCPKCGAQIPDSARFCPKCGNAIHAAGQTGAEAPAQRAQARQAPVAPASPSPPTGTGPIPTAGVVMVVGVALSFISSFLPWLVMAEGLATATSFTSYLGMGNTFRDSYNLLQIGEFGEDYSSYGGDGGMFTMAFAIALIGLVLMVVGSVMYLTRRNRVLLIVGSILLICIALFMSVVISQSSANSVSAEYTGEIVCIVGCVVAIVGAIGARSK